MKQRLFGNTNETCKPHGTLEEIGCGRFADLDFADRSTFAAYGQDLPDLPPCTAVMIEI